MIKYSDKNYCIQERILSFRHEQSYTSRILTPSPMLSLFNTFILIMILGIFKNF